MLRKVNMCKPRMGGLMNRYRSSGIILYPLLLDRFEMNNSTVVFCGNYSNKEYFVEGLFINHVVG